MNGERGECFEGEDDKHSNSEEGLCSGGKNVECSVGENSKCYGKDNYGTVNCSEILHKHLNCCFDNQCMGNVQSSVNMYDNYFHSISPVGFDGERDGDSAELGRGRLCDVSGSEVVNNRSFITMTEMKRQNRMCESASMCVGGSTKRNVNSMNDSHEHVNAESCFLPRSKVDSSTNSYLSCLALNVCGMHSKLLGPDLLCLMKDYDIVVISESKLDDFDKVSIPGFTAFGKNRSKFKKKSGGILLCIKDSLVRFVTVIENTERKNRIDKNLHKYYKFVDIDLSHDVLYFQFDKQLIGKHVLFGGVYFPPQGSPYFDIDSFTNVEHDITLLNPDSVCLLGDFNSRTASLNEFTNEYDNFVTDSMDTITLPPRSSNDLSTNRMGRSLLEFCNTTDIFIVNGRIGNNSFSRRCTSKDSSVVDYVLASLSLFDNVKDFRVLDFDEMFSDIHCPISVLFSFTGPITYSTPTHILNTDSNPTCNKRLTRPKWFADSDQKFKSKLHEHDHELIMLNSDIANMLSNLSDVSQTQVNDCCSKICKIMLNVGSDIGVCKNENINIKKNRKRKSDNLLWFDSDCEKKRKEFFKAKNMARKYKSDPGLLEKRSNASKNYKKQLHVSFKKYQSKFIKNIRKTKSSDPKTFWKIINGSKLDKNEAYTEIASQTFFKHFSSLGLSSDKTGCNDSAALSANDGTDVNVFLDAPFSENEVANVIKKLKNNKACGIDLITNEFLKAASNTFLSIFTDFFNLVLSSGKIPEDWAIGVIKPLYKNKGSTEDANNYRGITLLSCFGKVFTSLVNNRLNDFFEANNTLGEEQAGFRADHSVTDHIFTFHSIINFFIFMKKKLYCAFIDYEKAFDLVDRSLLWLKLINSGVSGRVLCIIKDIYSKAKSCVQWQTELTEFFTCPTGVRQGENLSPLLFSIFLNDLKGFISSKTDGLNTLKSQAENMNLEASVVNTLFQMFILLYADDTILIAETPSSLQTSLDAMYEYCSKWKLKINVSKTKVMVFSKGKIRKLPIFMLNGAKLEVTFDFQYLGIKFNYNGSFKPAQKNLYDKALKAMYCLIRKTRSLALPIDVQIELFDLTVAPILLYGAEVWCPQISDLVNKLQLRFYKMILKVNRSTPTCMVLGELGKYPLEVQAKSRMLNFWYRFICCSNNLKFSCIIYKFLFTMYESNYYKSPYLKYIESTLNEIGLSGVWTQQSSTIMFSIEGFKNEIKKRLQDQYVQSWITEINRNELFFNYRMYKINFEFEKYLVKLPSTLASYMIKFRTLNHKLPIQRGRIEKIERKFRYCNKCTANDIGDEFHYLFCCHFFLEKRKELIKTYFHKYPNAIKFNELFGSKNKKTLLKLSKFMKYIMTQI